MPPGFGLESTGYPLSFFRDNLAIHDPAASAIWLDAIIGLGFEKNDW